MNPINDGGPAFPVPETRDECGRQASDHQGMSLRDFFAAHAPMEPTWDFQPAMPSPRPEVKHPISRDGYAANHAEIEAWDEERARQRMMQWPYAWADAVLAARDVGMQPMAGDYEAETAVRDLIVATKSLCSQSPAAPGTPLREAADAARAAVRRLEAMIGRFVPATPVR